MTVTIILIVLAGVGMAAWNIHLNLLDWRQYGGHEEHARIDRDTFETTRQVDGLTERAVSAMLAEAMRQRLRNQHRG